MKMLGEDQKRREVGIGGSGVPALFSGMHGREISELKKEKVQYNGFYAAVH